MRRSRAVLAFLAVLLAAPSVPAQPAGDDTRAQARALGEEGLSFYDQGMYIDAFDRFERADAIIKAPTLGLMAARSLEKLGRLVEASERYLFVTRMNIDAKASDVWKQAVVSAGKEREAILPRIPTLEIAVEGPGAGGVTLRIDGRPVSKAILGIKTPIDPGTHRVDAKGTGDTSAWERVTLNEGQSVKITLRLATGSAGAQPSGEGPGAPLSGSGLGSGSDPSANAPSAGAMGLSGGKAGALDDQTRAAARVIGEEGLSFYDQGKYIDALDRFERADDLIKAPTLALMAARSLEKLDRLVEASDRYQQVAQIKLDAGASDAFKQAQLTATKERETLQPRIPTIDVSVEGPGASEVTSLMLDGRRVPPERLGSARPIAAKIQVDPGDHRVEAKSSGGEAFERVTVGEGGSERVVLTLTASANKLQAPNAAGKGAAATQEPQPTKSAPQERKGKGQQTAAWVSFGVGAAGLATGFIVGGLAAGKEGDFSARCSAERVCPPSATDDVQAYDTLRYVSTTGFIVGGVGAAVGTILLVTLPRGGARYSTGAARGPSVAPYIGVGSLGLKGSF